MEKAMKKPCIDLQSEYWDAKASTKERKKYKIDRDLEGAANFLGLAQFALVAPNLLILPPQIRCAVYCRIYEIPIQMFNQLTLMVFSGILP